MNFANSFLKDIKGNSSINQFGSKIKNMSQVRKIHKNVVLLKIF